MGKRRRTTSDFCFECQEPVRSLRRHYMRKHGGEPWIRTPSPPTTSGTPDGDAQSPSSKSQRREHNLRRLYDHRRDTSTTGGPLGQARGRSRGGTPRTVNRTATDRASRTDFACGRATDPERNLPTTSGHPGGRLPLEFRPCEAAGTSERSLPDRRRTPSRRP